MYFKIQFCFLLCSHNPLFLSCLTQPYSYHYRFWQVQIQWLEQEGKTHHFYSSASWTVSSSTQYSSEFIKDIIKIQSTVAVSSMFFIDINFYNASASISYISIKYLGHCSLWDIHSMCLVSVFQYNKQSLNWRSHLESIQLVSRRISCCWLLLFRATAALWGFPVTSLSSVSHLISFPDAFCLSLVWHSLHFAAKILKSIFCLSE